MILGTGVDMCEVVVIARAIERRGDQFLQGLFTPAERAGAAGRSDVARYFAQVFAAKEAFAKALGLGFGSQLRWTDIEIRSDGTGRGHATVKDGVDLLSPRDGTRAHVSWRQDAAFSIALVIIEANAA